MKNRLLLVLLGAWVCCSAVSGEETQMRRGDRNFNGGNRRFGGSRGGNFQGGRGGSRGGMNSSLFAEIAIAEKYPEEYAKINAMREKYEAELAALAQKAGVELPRSMESRMRQLRKVDPAAFDAAVKTMKTSPREGMQLLNELAQKNGITLFSMRGGRPGQPNPVGAAPAVPAAANYRPNLGKLRQKYPEKMKEYDTLRKSDAGKAKKLLLEIIEMDKRAAK